MNKRTVAITKEQYSEIIETIRMGFVGCRPNNRVATALVLEANLGLRISDIINLRMDSIIKDGKRYRLNVVEEKTGKTRDFTVPQQIYDFIKLYCYENNIIPNTVIFDVTERAIQKHLKKVCDYLGYTNVSTHSFRKFFATEIYINNNFNITTVQKLLQHSSTDVTQKYIGLQQREIEDALEKHIYLK